MTEKLIQKALFRLFSSHEFKFTNTYFFNNESDFLSFLSSGFCYECEIKISRSDFKADFKKEKHTIHKGNEIKSNLFLRKQGSSISRNLSWEFCRQFPELIESNEYISRRGRRDDPEEMVVDFHAVTSSRIEFVSHDNKLIPNKFFYVVPTGLISKEEVPEYAGLIYVDELGNCTKIKDGKFLHKDKLDPKRLFTKMYYSYERELQQKLK
jgi:hypothetical protein